MGCSTNCVTMLTLACKHRKQWAKDSPQFMQYFKDTSMHKTKLIIWNFHLQHHDISLKASDFWALQSSDFCAMVAQPEFICPKIKRISQKRMSWFYREGSIRANTMAVFGSIHLRRSLSIELQLLSHGNISHMQTITLSEKLNPKI